MGWGVNSPARLLRQNWTDANALAQELFAMFTAKEPPAPAAPTAKPSAPAPATTPLNEPAPGRVSDGETVTQRLYRTKAAPPTPPSIAPVLFPDSSRPTPGVADDPADETPPANDNPIGNLFTLTKKSSPGAGLIGYVVSKSNGGFATTLYPDGMGGDPGDTVLVIVPVLHPSEDLSGSWMIGIIQAGDSYYFQPPVWVD